MEFNFLEEQEKIMLANEHINGIITKYNEILMNLSDKEKNVMQLYYYFKKLDTFKSMTPKGNYWDDKREKYINKGLEIIKNLGTKTFSNIHSLDEIRKNVDSYMSNSDLLNIITSFSLEIKSAYKKYCDYVYTVLPISGIKELEESRHRENQYLNSINNGVFATATMESIEKYIARANVGGMIVHGNEIEYPSNPFLNISEEGLTLIKPVSIYLSNVDLFEPQFDYEIDSNGIPHFVYGGEWIAPHEKVPCIEKQTTYLPTSFLENNIVYYQENGEMIQINKEIKKL